MKTNHAAELRKVAKTVSAGVARRGRISPTLRTIAVTGGKGGVGKTNVATNLAIAMAQLGKRVGILDADLGLANVDVMLHVNPRYTLQHVVTGEKRIDEIIVKGPNTNRNIEVYIIPDTREGWIESLRLLLESYFHGIAPIEFNYTKIRKAGEPIKGFGGVSSGHEPLK